MKQLQKDSKIQISEKENQQQIDFDNTNTEISIKLANDEMKEKINKFNQYFSIFQGIFGFLEQKFNQQLILISSIKVIEINLYKFQKVKDVKVIFLNGSNQDHSNQIQKQFKQFMNDNNMQFSDNYDLTIKFSNNLDKLETNNNFILNQNYLNLNNVDSNTQYDKDKNFLRYISDKISSNFFKKQKVNQSNEMNKMFMKKVMHGQITHSYLKYDECNIEILLISRKDCRRLGSRILCRGLDNEASCANLVETEIITFITKQDVMPRINSQTILRGSIALPWEQKVGFFEIDGHCELIADSTESNRLFQKHFEEYFNKFEDMQVINLIDKSRHMQSKIAQEWDSQFKEQNKYKWFDFHEEAGKDYSGVSKLLNHTDGFTRKIGSDKIKLKFLDFDKQPEHDILDSQSGVYRVNCFDSLDRTNLVQSLQAKENLKLQLIKLFEITDDNLIQNLNQQIDQEMNMMWADNADALSKSQTGTNSLKTDFTRQGVRTIKGKILDGLNSCKRFQFNNIRGKERHNLYNTIQSSKEFDDELNWVINDIQIMKSIILIVLIIVGIIFAQVFWKIWNVLNYQIHPADDIIILALLFIPIQFLANLFKKLEVEG